jgi:CRISPR-associated exonuclease Cas4
MHWLALLLALVGVALLLLSRQRMRHLGLPQGRVIYLDSERLLPQESALFDPLSGISGKPDFLMQTAQGLVPVEVKSGKAPLAPYPSHVYQLAAYCHLVERVYGKRPLYGVLKYSDRGYRLEYGTELEESLLDLVAEVRRQGKREQDRTHNSSARCRGCGYREICDQRIE